ncbi:MAG TPA: BrnT family toxin [Bryobacteraceae bacterium]|nr:BrnT family toxin [Bryobacteraceae bacterium]
MVFTWDPKKAGGNLRKHGVDFHEAASVLGDPLSMTFPDPDHSAHELRFLTIGISGRRRVLVIAHTEEGETVRIISARRATRQERRFYEEE